MTNRLLIILISVFLYGILYGQTTATLSGRISTESGRPIEVVNIAVIGTTLGTSTDSSGFFSMKVPAQKQLIIGFSHLNYEFDTLLIYLNPNESRQISKRLKTKATELPTSEVFSKPDMRDPGITKLDPKYAVILPSPAGGIESVLKTIGTGVYSNNELSSQYSVRGGNFDENLVYVNDIEIYRPFLVRSGQQEGLSFINSQLVADISFSSGGFESQYGDKLSSVLDIRYKRPLSFAATAGISLLGANAHVEGIGLGKRFTYLIGIRQKSNQYILQGLDTKGSYKPSFTDFQTFLTYQITDRYEIGFLGNLSRNVYRFVPEDRETRFGTINEALRLKIFFDGQEMNRFDTYTGAIINTWNAGDNTELKLIASAFSTRESETFDVIGQYYLDQLEVDLGKDKFGDVAYNRGIGAFLNHARNRLEADVASIEHKGSWKNENELLWGIKYQYEVISDKVSEWQMLDSAGFSLPHPVDSPGYTIPWAQYRPVLELNDVLKSSAALQSSRYSGFVQYKWKIIDDSVRMFLTTGVRYTNWSVNRQGLISPRASLGFKPNWKPDIVFRLAAGLYYQPPFYRELRGFDGNLNMNLKAQKSTHFVLGGDYRLNIWRRPFKIVAEVYYKHLEDIIPYEVDNVRIRYFAENNAVGYATGIDLKIHGDFVKDIESWLSLSIMQTQEDILNDYYYNYYNSDGEKIIAGYTLNNIATDSARIEPGYIPRPTDQRFSFNLFFQDYLPRNPNFKMHINLVYGSRLPFGPPVHERYKATLRIPPYRRVDIGFSAMIKDENTKTRPNNPLHYCKTAWISIEVFNLLQISNTISYIWITDVTNRMYAVPNYLTPRQLNVKLHFDF